jgi:rod shape determining protein RodA
MSDYDRNLPSHDRDFGRGTPLAQLFHVDVWLLAPVILLIAGGLFVLYSASDSSADTLLRQCRNFVIAAVAMLVAAQISVDQYRRWAPLLYLLGLVLLIAVPLVGVGAKGAQRWLSLGIVRFQPSELMKLAMPLMIAWWYTRYGIPPRLLSLLGSLCLVLLPAACIVIQPDLGTSLLVAASGLFVIFIAGVSVWYLLSAAALSLLSAWPAWTYLLKDYQRQRILTLFDPESDRLGAGWPSFAFLTPWFKPRICALNRSEIAKPAASSRALLMRRPDDNRSSEVLRDDCESVKLRCAVSEATFVLIVKAIVPPILSLI